MVGEGSFRPCVLLGIPTFFLSNMFLAICGGGGGGGGGSAASSLHLAACIWH
jgi:hypothetical protein